MKYIFLILSLLVFSACNGGGGGGSGGSGGSGGTASGSVTPSGKLSIEVPTGSYLAAYNPYNKPAGFSASSISTLANGLISEITTGIGITVANSTLANGLISESTAGIGITVANQILSYACVRVKVSVSDIHSLSPSPVDEAVLLNLGLTNGSGKYFSNASCTRETTTAVISEGTSDTTIFFQGTSMGTLELEVSAPVQDLPDTSAKAPVNLMMSQRLSVGGVFSCAIVDGGVWCWGANENGRLGRGITGAMGIVLPEYYFPAPAVNVTSNMVAVAAGNYQTCALKDDGTVWCWGQGTFGQLGDGLPTLGFDPNTGNPDPSHDSGTPTKVNGIDSAQWISSGNHHVCAVAGGAAYCWGENTNGELGDGAKVSKSVPTLVFGLSSGVEKIAAGFGYSCAIVNGEVKCWGMNNRGQLGVPPADTADTCSYMFEGPCSTIPVNVPDLGSAAIDITADPTYPGNGWERTCALLANGTVKCWGGTTIGLDGSGSPLLSGLISTATSVLSNINFLVGGTHSNCAINTSNALFCWGGNTLGQLGIGTVDYEYHVNAEAITAFSPKVRYLARGLHHGCAVKEDQSLWCWGGNGYGNLGDGTETHSSSPVRVRVSSNINDGYFSVP